MNQKDPPLGGSRGTDALDVVVWFGSTAAPSNSGSANGGAGGDRPIGLSATTGWPQRILTVGGIQHRKGEDPHSKHTAEAQQLVRQFYTLESAGVSDSDAGRLSLHRVGSSTFAPTPTHAQQQQRGRREGAAWTPGPTVKKHHLQQQQQRPMSASVMSNTSNETLPISDGHHEDRSLVVDATGVHSSSHHKSAYIPVSTTQSGASSPSGLFERRRASVAQGLPRESLSLKLFRAAMEQQDGEGSGSGSPKLLGGRPPSGKTRPPSRGRARRPSSAASAASSAASTTPSLEEARRSSSGRSTAPKTASDFPSVEKCRDLNSTLALTRAAAVLASGGSGGAVSALIGLPTTHSAAQMPVATTTGTDVDADIANNSEPGKRQGMQSRLEAAGKPARPSSAVVSALRSTLGQSIMHTIRTTNAQQLLKVKHDMGPSPAEFAKQSSSHAQRLAHERLLYKHIPSDEASCMKLRQQLEEMQTEFARVEIDARMDDFKRRIPTNGSKRSHQGFGGSLSHGAATSSSTDTLHHHHASSGAPLTPASLHAMLNQHQQRQMGGQPPRSTSRGGHNVAHSTPARSSSLPFEATSGGRGPVPTSKEKIGHIPAQSRVTIGGKEFMYSEFFRPLTTGNGSGNPSR